MKEKTCVVCGSTYLPTGRCSKYCSDTCRDSILKSKSKIYQWRYNLKQGALIGIGSGTGSGTSNNNYKNGTGLFRGMSQALKQEFEQCERCGEDLFEKSRHHWCVHHKDANRSNNTWHNLELLCKRCHQVEHNCIAALEGVTTTRDQITGRYKRIEAPSNQTG